MHTYAQLYMYVYFVKHVHVIDASIVLMLLKRNMYAAFTDVRVHVHFVYSLFLNFFPFSTCRCHFLSSAAVSVSLSARSVSEMSCRERAGFFTSGHQRTEG